MIELAIYISFALLVGVVFGFLISSLKSKTKEQTLVSRLDSCQSQLESMNADLANAKAEIEKWRTSFSEKEKEVAVAEIQLIQIQEQLTEKKKELIETNQRLKSEFQVLANQILKQTSQEFTLANQKQIGELLNPLKEKIDGFEKRVNEVHSSDTKNRSELLGQVRQLMELNQQVREEANNLTSALKGDTKKQGIWGEFILEKVLENSGLEKGVEYQTQFSTKAEDKMLRPDVVVTLPDDKCVIVDAKVSLKAFESYISAEAEEDQKRFLDQHVASFRQHVKGLSSKNYHHYIDGKSLDFVLMFVPIEAGFSEALKADSGLYNYAWDHRIVIVSPTTLLATLRTIASVWKQEKQNRNVIQIAEESGKLYDKFVLFIQDLEKIKRGIDQSANAYDDAFKKLSTGRGNLINKAEQIKQLGAKANKGLDQRLIEGSED